ncbi:MAG TPA: hypothetical protein PKW33_04225 [Anaerolineaceae bacterium]|nr:hypothetical protein [Anaerolineaceae bacterium]HPN50769.1 hypothetical protein [Anaerolineaceae bacterium]
MMTAFLELTLDKFIFRVDPACAYTPQGIWVKEAGPVNRLGLSDFLQQRSGDVAFAEVKPAGSILAAGAAFASIETIKVDVDLLLPAAARVVRVNPALGTAPEVINQDPYGDGWLCEVEWQEKPQLLAAAAYFEQMEKEAREEHP